MMNDFDQVDSLQRKVSSLEEENAKLKHRIEELEQELALNGYVLDEEENVTVNNYYLKKYIEIHNDVYDERIKDLEDKRKNLQDEYDGIVEQEKGIETITIKNESLIKRIEEIDQIISDNYYNCTNEILLGLGKMYISDERFKENLDQYETGNAKFISSAIKFYCK